MFSCGRSIWLRILCFILCIMIVAIYPLNAYAVSPLQFGGFISNAYNLYYDLMMIGINASSGEDAIRTSFGHQSVYPTMKEWITALGQNFVEDAYSSLTWDSFVNSLAGGVSYDSSGVLHVNENTSGQIHSFMEWLNDNGYIDVVDESTSNNGTVTNAGGISGLSGISYPYTVHKITSYRNTSNKVEDFNYLVYEEYTYTSSVYYVTVGLGAAKWRYGFAVAENPFTCNVKKQYRDDVSTSTKSVSSTSYNGKTFYYTFLAIGNDYTNNVDNNGIGYVDGSSYLGRLAYNMIYGSTFESINNGAGYDVWNQEDDEDGYVIDPGAVIGGFGTDVQGGIANIGDYLDSIADVIAGADSVALPVAGIGDVAITPAVDAVIPVDVAIPDSIPVTIFHGFEAQA